MLKSVLFGFVVVSLLGIADGPLGHFVRGFPALAGIGVGMLLVGVLWQLERHDFLA